MVSNAGWVSVTARRVTVSSPSRFILNQVAMPSRARKASHLVEHALVLIEPVESLGEVAVAGVSEKRLRTQLRGQG